MFDLMDNARIPLHLIWLVDTSRSMSGAKIHALNFAIREAIPEMQKVADENPNAQVLMSVATFSNGARWHVRRPTDVASLAFPDLTTDESEERDVDAALCLIAERLRIPPMPCLAFRPMLILVSDGTPSSPDLEYGMSVLESQPWGRVATRVAIPAGDRADLHKLTRFLSHPEAGFFQGSCARLLSRINWIPVRVTQGMTCEYSEPNPRSELPGTPVPPPPWSPLDSGSTDVW